MATTPAKSRPTTRRSNAALGASLKEQKAAAKAASNRSSVIRIAPPTTLSDRAGEIWNDLVSICPHLTHADAYLLANYCELAARCEAFSKQLPTLPMTVKNRHGVQGPNPAIQLGMMAQRTLMTLGQRLRLDARSRLTQRSTPDVLAPSANGDEPRAGRFDPVAFLREQTAKSKPAQ